MREKHKDIPSGDAAPETATEAAHDTGITPGSVKLLSAFIEKGILNPKIMPTQKGFNRMCAAWILEDDLPFTTAESDGFNRLLKYCGIKFTLPSDTTVRSNVRDVFKELHGIVVREISVCSVIKLLTRPDSIAARAERRLKTGVSV